MSVQHTYVIAEAGVNHNGDVERAVCMVDAAADAGADAVKFQTFRADEVASATAEKARYQKATTGTDESQLEMLRRLELAPADHDTIAARCRERGIEFLSTAFDTLSLDMLVDGLGIGRIKIPSGEITNGPLILHAASKNLPVIVSTGMATLDEVTEALGVLAFGWTRDAVPSGRADFAESLASPHGRKRVQERVTILQCTTEYPTPFDDVNLRVMDTFRAEFGTAVGLSDHTQGIAVPIAAVALGAELIEKHFTLDRSLPGPDHAASLEPDELREMVAGIRAVERALGSGVKSPQTSEQPNRDVARRSLVAARPVAAGSHYAAADITAKRPGRGVSPMQLWALLGTAAPADLATGEEIPE